MKKKLVIVNDLMQKDYRYYLTEEIGENFAEGFEPDLSPKEMLELGVFGGKYMTDCLDEFPESWFGDAKFCKEKHDASLNFFKINASQSLQVWQEKGWIDSDDPRGWFQWYCRYYFGRRHADDERQIKRWRAFKRHLGAVRNNCSKGDWTCRPKQRQALLHWGYDSREA